MTEYARPDEEFANSIRVSGRLPFDGVGGSSRGVPDEK